MLYLLLVLTLTKILHSIKKTKNYYLLTLQTKLTSVFLKMSPSYPGIHRIPLQALKLSAAYDTLIDARVIARIVS